MNVFQIGANDGEDDAFNFINYHRDQISCAVLVEPILPCISKLIKRYEGYKNVHIENVAIHADENISSVPFFYMEDDQYQLSSIKKNHLTGHGVPEDKIKTINVRCLTISKLLDKYRINHLEKLYIDAEGYDYDIIKSINFTKVIIKEIIFESMHIDGVHRKEQKYSDLLCFLGNNGYRVNTPNGLNSIATLK